MTTDMDMTGLSEAEWTDTWTQIHAEAVKTRDALTDPDTGVDLSPVQAAHLDGEITMLRRVLTSRGVPLD